MKMTWLGHAAFRIESGSHVIVIDPFLSGNPKFTGSIDEVARGVTHVVLTHGHDDHVGDTVEICKKTNATLVAPYELAAYLQGKGVEKINPGNPGGTVPLSDTVAVHLTKAYHSSSTIVDGKPIYLGDASGVVIEGLGRSVYHMGDTDIFGDMALIEELFHPQIGLVPIGDRFAMGPRTASLACKRYFKFETVIPMHYGTFPIIEQEPSKFVAAMAGQNVMIPEIGVPFEI